MIIKRILAFCIISEILFIISIPLNIYPQDTFSGYTENSTTDRYSHWLENSNSEDDLIIIEYLNIADFEEKIKAINLISKRKDRNFSLMLKNIYYQYFENKNEKEFLFHLMLDTFFTDEKSVIESWDSFFLICNDIENYNHSLLRKTIMKKTSLLDKKNAEAIMVKEAIFLLNKGKKSKIFNDEMIEESRIFFIYSGKIDSTVLSDYRQQIYVTVSNIPDSFRN